MNNCIITDIHIICIISLTIKKKIQKNETLASCVLYNKLWQNPYQPNRILNNNNLTLLHILCGGVGDVIPFDIQCCDVCITFLYVANEIY